MTTAVDEWMARGDDEDVLWSGRPRTTRVLPAVAVGLVLALVAVGLVATGDRLEFALFVPVGLAVPGWAYLQVVNTRYVVTDRALYRKTGVLSRTVQRVALRRVQNSTFRQDVTGSLFGYGTIHVEAAGGGSIRFSDVVGPEEVRALVERETGVEEIPGSIEQWEAVLSEVRALRRTFDSTAQ